MAHRISQNVIPFSVKERALLKVLDKIEDECRSIALFSSGRLKDTVQDTADRAAKASDRIRAKYALFV